MKKILLITAIVLIGCTTEDPSPETGLIYINLDLTAVQLFEAQAPVNKGAQVLFRFSDSLNIYNEYIEASKIMGTKTFEVPASVNEVFINMELNALNSKVTEKVSIDNYYSFTLTDY